MGEKYRPQYHIHAVKGLVNDPNGLVQFRGKYHVFFQWNQHGTTHENKSWGHWVSTDMVNWEKLEPALDPVDWFDKNGVYSGSAVVHQDTLYLFYTGNVKDNEGNRQTYQCLATSTDGEHFVKKGVLFTYPEGYTAHVRDPKVWYDEQLAQWAMVLGAQRDDLTGDTILYTSTDLEHWVFQGSILQFEQSLGFMWECPDVVQFSEQDVFIFSPQGVEPQGFKYHNIYQTCYVVGKFDNGKFIPKLQEMVELDRGFEFYAPQTFTTDDGRVVLYAWIGTMPEEMEKTMPTVRDGWIHQLSAPRELVLKKDKLYQYPVQELENLRKDARDIGHHKQWTLESYASDIVYTNMPDQSFTLMLRNEVTLDFDKEKSIFTVERTNWASKEREKRQCYISKITDLRLLIEDSSVEIFINRGKEAFSLRYFAEEIKEVTTNIQAKGVCYRMD